MTPAILMRALALACVACFMIAGANIALAQDTTVKVGSLFGALKPYVDEMVATLIAAAFAYVALLLRSVATRFKEKTGIDMEEALRQIEAHHRAAIEAFLVTQAGALIAKIGDPLLAMKLDLKNETLAYLANEALVRVPDALKRFGLTPEVLRGRILAKVGLIAGAQASVPVTAPPTA